MSGPTLELNVSAPGLATVKALSDALDALATKAGSLNIKQGSDGIAEQLTRMADQSKSAMEELTQVMQSSFKEVVELQMKAGEATKRIREKSAADASSSAAETVAKQQRIEQAGYEQSLRDFETFTEERLRALKAAGVKLSIGHRLSLSMGASGSAQTGASFAEAGGDAAEQLAIAKRAADERLAVAKGLSKAISTLEGQLIFEAETRNDHLTRMAKKAADERLDLEKGLTKGITGAWSAMLFEAETRNDHLTRMAKKSADERLAIEKALFTATNNLGRAAVATERFNQASPESKVSGASMARAKLAAGFSAADVAMAHGFAAATYNADGALDKLSKSASKSGGPLKDLANNLGSTHSAARGLASGFNAMWLTWGNVGPLLAGAALSHSIMQAVKEGSKLEQTLTSMSVLGRTSTEDMAGLRKELDKLAVSGPQGIQEIASAMKTLTLAGLDAKNTAQALSSVMNFSMAGELPVEKAAEVLVAVGTAYGYTAKSYSYVANMITSAAVSSTASVDSMSESFKQATSLSSTFGVSLKDTSLGLALLAQTGVQGSAAGTALRNFYSDIVGRTPKVVAALKQLGVSAYYKEGPMKGQIKDFQTLGTELSRAALKITDVEKRTRLLQDVLSERGGKVGAGLSQALLDITVSDTGEVTNGIDRMAKEIEKSMGIVEIGAARMKLTAQSQMKQTANVFQQAFQEAFLALEPTIIVVTKQLQGIFGSEEFKQGIVSITVSVATLIRSLVEYKDILLGVGAAMAVWKTAKFGMALGGAATELATGLLGAKVAYNQGATAAQVFTAATGNGVKTLLATQAAATTTSVAVTAIGAASNAAVAPIGRAAVAMQFLNKASGWIGVIASLLTTAASAWGIYSLYQKKATDDTAEATKTTYADLLKSLDEQVVKQREILAKLREGKTERQAETAAIEAGNLAIADRALLEGDWGKRRAAAMETLTRARAGTSASPVSQIPGSRAAPEPTQAQRLAEAAALRVLANIDAERVGHLQALKDRQAELGRLAIATGVEADKQRKKESDAEQARIVAEQKGLRGAATTPKPSDQEADELANLAKKIQYQKDVNAELTAGASIEAAQATAQFMQIEGARQNIALVNKFNDAWAEAYAEQEKTKKLEAEIRAARDYKAETDQLNAENELLAKGLNLKQARADIEGKRLGFTPEAVTARTGAVGTQENLLAEQEKWKKLVEDLKSEDPFSGWGRSLSAVFKSSGDAVEQLIAGSRALNKSQIDGEEALTAIKAKRSEMVLSEDPQDMRAIAKLEQAQIKKTTQQQLASYATIASGAKKLLKEHTTGYKVLEAAEKGFRVYQMYMANQKMVEEVAGIAKTVGAFLFGETAKVGATATGQASRTALETAGEAARNVAKVPGVFMSFMSSLGPYGLAAAGVAIAAVLGSAFSGTKGSAADSAAMQETQGTGTVFGDPKAKSESLTKALEHLQDMAAPQLKYTAQMAASLRNIEGSIVGVAGQIIRTGGAVTGADFISAASQNNAGLTKAVTAGVNAVLTNYTFGLYNVADKLLGGAMSNVVGSLVSGFFGKTKTNLQDSGVQFGAQSLESILSGGVSASSYQSTETVKKALFGLSKTKTYSTSYEAIDENITNQLTNLIKDTYAGIITATTAMGVSADVTKDKLAGFTVDLGKLSLKGLTGAQIQEQLTSVFGAFADKLAFASDSTLVPFQRAGEGYFETLTRVASGVELAKSITDKLGMSMISYADITYKQSEVTAELVRQSILASEGLSGIGAMVDGLSGDAQELADTYTQLLSIRYALQAFGSASVDVSSAMIAGAGDLDTLAQGAADYTENFLSESERLTKSTSDMARQFARLGVTLPDSNEAFKTLLLGIDGSTEAGQKLYGSVLALSGSFAELSSSAESFDTSKVEMQLAILKAQGKDEQALAIERERILKATDPMLKALQQEVWATEDAAKATQTLTESLNKLNDAGKQISDYLDSLSGQTGAGGLAVSRGTYLSTLSGAKTNDLGALGKITGTASAYLKDAENFSRTSAEYLATVAQVRSELANLEAVKSYKSSIDGSHASGLDYVPFDGYVAQLHKGERVETAAQARQKDEMLAELQAMRVESKAIQTAQATNSLLMRKILDKWDQDGMPAVRT